MKFREALKIIEGLRFIADELPLMSALGRSCLMDSELITDISTLKEEYTYLALSMQLLSDPKTKVIVSELQHLLMQARDIRTTARRLADAATLDDVELFEIKGLALLSKEIKPLLAKTGLSAISHLEMPDLGKVFDTLDPEKTGNAHFHIYDAYSEKLAEKRKRLKRMQAAESHDADETDRILAECMALEEEVRKAISKTLYPYASSLADALEAIGNTDLLLAKAMFAGDWRLAIPSLADNHISYSSLRYLPAVNQLKNVNKEFQPIDIFLANGVTLITGANMGGKTITLKSLALAQMMTQFVLGIPAESGEVSSVESIALSIGDRQSAGEGLSSFGAEILAIDHILSRATEGERMLVLIDEPARTTNPEEGKAIVCALIEMLDKTSSISVLTTHYSNIDSTCTRLKVKGLRDSVDTDIRNLRPGALIDFMDYSLISDINADVDREALRIARLLGVSKNFSDSIENNLIKK